MIAMNKGSDNNLRINDRIRISPVRVIDESGTNLGVLYTDEAKSLARSKGLDLVEVSPQMRPPVCRIMDYGKFLYEQSKKQKKAKPHSQLKELRFRPNIGEHDLETKINQLIKFIKSGDKVQIKVMFVARENAHKDLGFTLVNRMIDRVKDIAKVQNPPRLEGKFLNCTLEPEVKNVE